MKKKLGLILLLLVLVLIVEGAYFLYDFLGDKYTPQKLPVKTPSEVSDTSDIQPAPDFVVYDYAGNKVALSDMKGKPTVMFFWATWCPNCVAGMPDYNSLYEKYNDTVNFMMINMTDGQRETTQIAKEYIDKHGYTFSVYYDTDMSAAIAYEASSIPMTIFVDSEGNLITSAVGKLDSATIEKGIEMIIN